MLALPPANPWVVTARKRVVKPWRPPNWVGSPSNRPIRMPIRRAERDRAERGSGQMGCLSSRIGACILESNAGSGAPVWRATQHDSPMGTSAGGSPEAA